MFELKEISAAHLKVKSGNDFPAYVQELIALGVQRYETTVSDGRIKYFGDADYEIKTKPKYARLNISNIPDNERFKHYLRIHQRGQSDYPTFCKQCAETGVEKWIVDTAKLTCTYYDKFGNVMLEEEIPKIVASTKG
jgi:uncharacterized protein YbcV (DUF1398 family)